MGHITCNNGFPLSDDSTYTATKILRAVPYVSKSGFRPENRLFPEYENGPCACAEAASICWILRYNEIRNNFRPT